MNNLCNNSMQFWVLTPVHRRGGIKRVRKEGLEPSSLAAQASETCVFAISPLPRRRREKRALV